MVGPSEGSEGPLGADDRRGARSPPRPGLAAPSSWLKDRSGAPADTPEGVARPLGQVARGARRRRPVLSRLSFRAKLLLVLFVPFLALVVVAAAGLSDRFSALHAQEQYGDLSAPVALARRSQPGTRERECGLVVVRRSQRLADDRARRRPSCYRRRGTTVPRRRDALRRGGGQRRRRRRVEHHQSQPRRIDDGAELRRQSQQLSQRGARLLPWTSTTTSCASAPEWHATWLIPRRRRA